MKKAQSSVEFITLIGFAIAGFAILLMAFEGQMVNTERNIEFTRTEEVFNIIQEEIRFAYNSPYNYKRSFELPPSINNEDYTISFDDGVEVALTVKGNDYVYFLSHEVGGEDLVIGTNTVQKFCELGECTIYLNVDDVSPSAIGISNCEALQNMQNNLSAHYYLTNNINCAETSDWNEGEGFVPIGDDTNPFEGILDGRGNKISDLYINRSDSSRQGLFGELRDATIRNIYLEDFDITGESVGGLSRVATDEVTIVNVHVTGNFFSTEGSHNSALIGLIREISSSGGTQIINSSVDATVIHDSNTGGWHTGLLVGTIRGDFGLINSSFARGYVEGRNVGGLIGNFDDSTSIVSNSYSQANVTGINNAGYGAGGLIGRINGGAPTILNSYTVSEVSTTEGTSGGLIGLTTSSGSPTITSSYWDTDVGPGTSTGGEEMSTSDMQNITTYTDWNISTLEDYTNEIWVIQENDYPRLAWE